MAVAEARRGSKRRKLSPPEEDRTQHSKKKQEIQQNGSNSLENSTTIASQTPQSIEMPSVKGLDSSEPAIRRSTLKTILENLQSRPSSAPFTSTQCLQLWRGFFVAIYMHDSRNALSVQNLLREVAGTFSIMASKDDELQSSKASSTRSEPAVGDETWLKPFHSAFWETVSREWAGIDSHRMNKYLLLTRFVLRELFTICMRDIFEPKEADTEPKTKTKSKKKSTVTEETARKPTALQRSTKTTEECLEILETVGPLNPSQRRISDGLRLHVLDILNDELFGALGDLEDAHTLAEDDKKAIALRAMQLVPLLFMIRTSVEKTTPGDCGAQKHVRLRAKDAVKTMNEQLEERSLSIPETEEK